MNKRNFHANYVNGCRNKFIKSCVSQSTENRSPIVFKYPLENLELDSNYDI